MSLTTAALVGDLFITYKVWIHSHEFKVHFSLTVQLTSQAHAIAGGGLTHLQVETKNHKILWTQL